MEQKSEFLFKKKKIDTKRTKTMLNLSSVTSTKQHGETQLKIIA